MSERVACVADVQIKTQGKRGTIVVDGHDISSVVSYIGVTAPAGALPTVTVHLAMPTVSFEGEATVALPEAIEAALVRLGWTPPHE